jgi:hypothetical protein
MQRVDGRKVIVLTRGDLSVGWSNSNLHSNVQLHRQKSAEAIVPERGRAEQQRFWTWKDSREERRKQTTSGGPEGSRCASGVELRENAAALSDFPVSERRKDDEQEDEEVERIVFL